jgi:hypothetical protein
MKKKDQEEIAKLYTEGWYSADGDRLPHGDVDEGDYEENRVQAGNIQNRSIQDRVLSDVLQSIQNWKSTGEGLQGVIADMEVALMNIRNNS